MVSLSSPGSEALSFPGQMTQELEVMASNPKPPPAERLLQGRIQLVDKIRVVRRRQVMNLPRLDVPEVVMAVNPAVKTSRAAGVRQLAGQAGVDQSFERLVDRGQADMRNL